MLISVYSLEYGKYLWEQGCAKHCRYMLFGKKFFLLIWMRTFRIWPFEAVIMQANVRLSHKKL